MKYYPILFSTDMVKAILEGRKTMTRRVIKPQPPVIRELSDSCSEFSVCGHDYRCPYGQVGDRLWVRETFTVVDYDQTLVFKAECDNEALKAVIELGSKWRPSIHMPRWAARINLENTEIRVEKQLDITLEDAIKEGFDSIREFNESFLKYNPHLKNENSWLWVISFKEIK